MKRDFILQFLCTFAIIFAGISKPIEVKAQWSCSLNGFPGYDEMLLNQLHICNGDVTKVLRGDGSQGPLSSGMVTTALGYTPYNGTINPNGYLTSEVDGSVTNEIELPSQVGNSGKYLTTNGTSPSWFSPKRQETYSGTTSTVGGNAGTYQVTFGTAYSVAPNIQANIINGADNQNIRITAISTTGFTVLVRTRTDVVGLLPSWAGANGLAVDVLISEK